MTVKVMGLACRRGVLALFFFASGTEARQGGDAFGSVYGSPAPEGDACRGRAETYSPRRQRTLRGRGVAAPARRRR
jgi:hypothetical protein